MPILLLAIGVILSLVVFIAVKRYSNNLANGVLTAVIAALVPIALSGACIAGVTNVQANAANVSNAGQEIEVYVNTEGGAIHFGEGEKSNVQTYTNKTDRVIFINELGISPASGNEGVNIGQWSATVNGAVVFKGGAGESQKLASPIYLNPNESVLITWQTSATSEDLIGLAGSSPANINYLADTAATEEDKEKAKKEIDAEALDALDKIDDLSDELTPEQLDELGDKIQKLIDEYEEKIKNATTEDEIEKLKEEFEEKVLQVEKESLNETMDNKEEKFDDTIKDIEGLSESDDERYNDKFNEEKEKAKKDIEDADNYPDAKERKEEFDKKVDDLIKEGQDLGKDKLDTNEKFEQESQENKDTINDPDVFEELRDGAKERFEEEIDKAKQEYQDAIADQPNQEEMQKLREEFEDKMNDILNEAEELDTDITDKKDELGQDADDQKSLIEEQEISDIEKQAFYDEIDRLLDEGKDVIQESTDTSESQSGYSEYKNDIGSLWVRRSVLDFKVRDGERDVEGVTFH